MGSDGLTIVIEFGGNLIMLILIQGQQVLALEGTSAPYYSHSQQGLEARKFNLARLVRLAARRLFIFPVQAKERYIIRPEHFFAAWHWRVVCVLSRALIWQKGSSKNASFLPSCLQGRKTCPQKVCRREGRKHFFYSIKCSLQPD